MDAVGIFAPTTFSVPDVGAQTANNNTSSSSQNQTNMIMRGPNITGSISIGSTIAKAIASQAHISLENASMTAEKAVGANSHAVAVRIGVVHGFLVWMAFVLDSNNNFHSVIVDPRKWKSAVLSSNDAKWHGFRYDGFRYVRLQRRNDAAWNDEGAWNDDRSSIKTTNTFFSESKK